MCILQAINNWRRERPGNEATILVGGVWATSKPGFPFWILSHSFGEKFKAARQNPERKPGFEAVGSGYETRWLFTINPKVPCIIYRGGSGRGGRGHGGPMPPPLGLVPRETRRFATRLAHVASLTHCTSLYESLLHVLHT